MDLNKHLSFFNPVKLKNSEIHIIGCGAIGSNVALQLAKLGVETLTLWDFDIVTEHNVTNQVYDFYDVNKKKTEALKEHLLKQNPRIKVNCRGKYTYSPLKGLIIMCVDSVETRKKIAEANQYNIGIQLLIDGRIGLTEGQVYCVNWTDSQEIEKYIKLTDFKDDEVQTPVSPCGTTLSVSPSVLITVSYMISCLINFVNDKPNPPIIMLDAFNFKTITFK